MLISQLFGQNFFSNSRQQKIKFVHFTCYTYFCTILYFWLFLFTHQHHIQIMMPKISNLQCIFTEIISDWPYTHISLNFYFDFSVIIQRYPSLYNINILGSYKIYLCLQDLWDLKCTYRQEGSPFLLILFWEKKNIFLWSLTTNLHNQDYQHISLVLPHLTGPFVCLGWNLLPPSVKKSLMQEELADGNPKTHPRRNNLKIKLRITHLLAKTKRPLTTGIGKTVHHEVMKIEIFWKMFRRFVDYQKEFWKADKYRLTVWLSEETTENILLALTSVTSFFKTNLRE